MQGIQREIGWHNEGLRHLHPGKSKHDEGSFTLERNVLQVIIWNNLVKRDIVVFHLLHRRTPYTPKMYVILIIIIIIILITITIIYLNRENQLKAELSFEIHVKVCVHIGCCSVWIYCELL